MSDSNASDQAQSLRERRDFVKAAIKSAGVALAIPTVLSVVKVDALQAQVSPGDGGGGGDGI